MKKFLFAIVALASCMTVSAKYWVGGCFAFDSKTQYDGAPKQTTAILAPSIGMEIEDNLEIGLDFKISELKNINNQSEKFSFAFAPFMRYTFLTQGDFSMFVQGGLEYGIVSPSGANLWHISLMLQPGIKYSVSDNFSLLAKMDGLYYSHENNAIGHEYKDNIGLGLHVADLWLGLVYEF